MPSPHWYKVKQVAQLSRVSIRALHHYDDIGLLVPSGRSQAGYRLYTDGDLLRLQQILIGRELGLSLEQIRRSLDDPQFDRRSALRAQRAQLAERAERAAQMICAVEAALAIVEQQQQTENTDVDFTRIFDGFDPGEHAAEAERRWGDTDAYRESMQRAKSYTERDWRAVRDEQAAIYADAFAALMAGAAPDGASAMDVAERHRLSIDRWFYRCSARMHSRLADLYEADERFAANIDTHGPGLTAFLAAAIRANAARQPT